MSEELKLSSGKIVNGGNIRVAKNVYRYNTFSKFLTIFSLLFLVLACIYFCFAITIIRILPFSNMGMVPVKNLTVVGGIAQPEKVLYVNTAHEEGDDYMDRARQAFIPANNVAKVKVVTGPYGTITASTSTSIKVNNKTINKVDGSSLKDKKFLNGEYVVECISGDCMVGDNFIISSKNIYGEPLEKVK